jgi:hypothetical protein
MMYLKGMLAGFVAALAASALYVLAVFVLPILLPFVLSRMTGTGGAAAAYMSSGPVLAIAVIAFAAGFYWQLRRGSR